MNNNLAAENYFWTQYSMVGFRPLRQGLWGKMEVRTPHSSWHQSSCSSPSSQGLDFPAIPPLTRTCRYWAAVHLYKGIHWLDKFSSSSIFFQYFEIFHVIYDSSLENRLVIQNAPWCLCAYELCSSKINLCFHSLIIMCVSVCVCNNLANLGIYLQGGNACPIINFIHF